MTAAVFKTKQKVLCIPIKKVRTLQIWKATIVELVKACVNVVRVCDYIYSSKVSVVKM